MTVEELAAEIVAQLRRRRAASYRLAPLADGRRDPLDPALRDPEPSTFGLPTAELAAEVARRAAEGWRHWELVSRFVGVAGTDTVSAPSEDVAA